MHDGPTDELLDELALYALDILDSDRTRGLEKHLETCDQCQAEVDAFREAAAAMAYALPLEDPPSSLRDAVLAITREPGPESEIPTSAAQVWKEWEGSVTTGLQVVRDGEGDWQEVHTGVWAKRLRVDFENDQVTMLIRMDRGASYVPHRHAGPEQCYVLSGDLLERDLVLHAGDYQCAASGSVHGVQSTETGCLLLIVSSLRDELLE